MQRTKNTKKAFTLIELLVVITIIGILAVGAVGVYTTQIQKARDTARLADTDVLSSAAEQTFQDAGAYPLADTLANFTGAVTKYIKGNFPKDPKSGQVGSGTILGYIYASGKDPTTGIINQTYEISTAMENEGNLTSKAAKDGGDDILRYERGVNIDKNANAGLDTHCDGSGCILPVGALQL